MLARRTLLSVAIAAIIVGCTDAERMTAVTATPTSAGAPATATATSTREPLSRVWDVPPKTNIAHLDSIVGAVVSGSVPELQPFITGIPLACSTAADPVCKANEPLGMLVSVVGMFWCPGDGEVLRLGAGPASPSRQIASVRVTGETTKEAWAQISVAESRYLIAAYRLGPAKGFTLGGRDLLQFAADRRGASGTLLSVTDEGVTMTARWNTACDLSYFLGTESTAIVAPPPT